MRRDAAHRILFVEPSAALRRRLEQIALSYGWDAVACEDIPDAEVAVGSGTFDLVVTAVVLPSGAYGDVVTRLRKLDGMATVPIVLLTGEDAAGIQSLALGQGVTEVFSDDDFVAFENYLKDQPRARDELLGLRALVLEDDPVVCHFVVEVLRQMELKVDGFNQLDEAQMAAHSNPYRLIIADLVLDKGQSGNKFIRTLRHSNGRSSNALIIAISAIQDTARRLDALRAGADIFLSKPFSQEELVIQVKRLLSRAPELAFPSNPLSGNEEFNLSKRERMICSMVVAGQPDKHIASRLGISFWTVRTHMSRIFRKCGVNNRVELSNLLRGSENSRVRETPPLGQTTEAQSAVLEWLSLASHVVDGLAHGVLVTDENWNTLYSNPCFSRISGHAGNDLLGKKTHLMNDAGKSEGLHDRIIAALNNAGFWSGRLAHTRADGKTRCDQVSIQTLPPSMPLQARYILEILDADIPAENTQKPKDPYV